MILATLDDVVACGELQSVWELGFLKNRECSCGRRFSDCDFWRRVVDLSGLHAKDARAAIRAVQRVGRVRYSYGRFLIGRAGSSQGDDWHEARNLNSRLLEAVGAAAGATVIVDSSPNPLRAIMLSEIADGGFVAMHLVRDPRAVAYSWMNPKFDPVVEGMMESRGSAAASVLWNTRNLAIEALRFRMTVRRFAYEEIVGAPGATFRRIVDGIPAIRGQQVAIEESVATIGENHLILGNPVRVTTGSIVIREDLRYRDGLRPRKRYLVESLTAPLRYRYGY